MPLSRIVPAACLKAFAGLNALVAVLLLALTAMRLFKTGLSNETAEVAILAGGFAAGVFVCRWAARRIETS